MKALLWRLGFAAIFVGGGIAIADYQATQGTGTSFGSKVLGGIHFPEMLVCDATTAGQCAAVSSSGGLAISGASEYPTGATPETASNTGTSAPTVATLATAAGKTTFICGFSIRANATAAVTADSTVAGTITGTLHYTQWTAPLASGLGVTEQIFTPCIPAAANNTTIVVTSAPAGAGGVTSVSAWGYLVTGNGY